MLAVLLFHNNSFKVSSHSKLHMYQLHNMFLMVGETKHLEETHVSTARTCKLHAERPCCSRESNPEPFCQEATVLSTAPSFFKRLSGCQRADGLHRSHRFTPHTLCIQSNQVTLCCCRSMNWAWSLSVLRPEHAFCTVHLWTTADLSARPDWENGFIHTKNKDPHQSAHT